MSTFSSNSAIKASITTALQGAWSDSPHERIRRLAARLEPIAGTVPSLREYLQVLSTSRFAQAAGGRRDGYVDYPGLDAARRRVIVELLILASCAECESIRRYITSRERDMESTAKALRELGRRLEEARLRRDVEERNLDAQGSQGLNSLLHLNLVGVATSAAGTANAVERVRKAQAEVESLERQLEQLQRDRDLLESELNQLVLAVFICERATNRLRGS